MDIQLCTIPWKKGTIEVMKVKRNLFRGAGHARLIGFTKQPTHLGLQVGMF